MPKRVLAIDAIATNRIRFAALLESVRYEVQTAAHAAGFDGNPRDFDLVLLGLPNEQPGQAIAGLAMSLKGSTTPILCLDAKSTSLRRLMVLRAGARDILPSKSPDDLLLARVRGLIREGEAEREAERRKATAASFGFSEPANAFASLARVVCIGNLGQVPDRLSAMMPHDIAHLPAERVLTGGAEPGAPADAFVLHTGTDRKALSRVLPELRDQNHLSPVPVMAVYPECRPDMATLALALGAGEIIAETSGLAEFELRLSKMLARKSEQDAMRRADEQSYRLAATDPLTGLYNRRYAETYLSGLAARMDGQSSEFCLVLIDLDHFKAINDTHGHAAGDSVLSEVALRLQDNLRSCDLVARYGGEEFMVVLPETSPDMAKRLAERLRHAIAARGIPAAKGLRIDVTASIGVAAHALEPEMIGRWTGTGDTLETLSSGPFQAAFEAADAALYSAKNAGRNRVEITVA